MRFFFIAIFLLNSVAHAVDFDGVSETDKKYILSQFPTLNTNLPDYSIIDMAIAKLSDTKNYELVKAIIKNKKVKIICNLCL